VSRNSLAERDADPKGSAELPWGIRFMGKEPENQIRFLRPGIPAR
jgi:hypothetical protein